MVCCSIREFHHSKNRASIDHPGARRRSCLLLMSTRTQSWCLSSTSERHKCGVMNLWLAVRDWRSCIERSNRRLIDNMDTRGHYGEPIVPIELSIRWFIIALLYHCQYYQEQKQRPTYLEMFFTRAKDIRRSGAACVCTGKRCLVDRGPWFGVAIATNASQKKQINKASNRILFHLHIAYGQRSASHTIMRSHGFTGLLVSNISMLSLRISSSAAAQWR